jgi:hypothetical protein
MGEAREMHGSFNYVRLAPHLVQDDTVNSLEVRHPQSVGLGRRRKLSQEILQSLRRVSRTLYCGAYIFELKAYSREDFSIAQQFLEQFLPVYNLAILKNQFQGNVLEEEIFGGAEDGG